MQVDELRQARALAEENGRLKRIVADLTVQIDILKAINAKKNGEPGQQATCGTIRHAKRSGRDRAGVSCLGGLHGRATTGWQKSARRRGIDEFASCG